MQWQRPPQRPAQPALPEVREFPWAMWVKVLLAAAAAIAIAYMVGAYLTGPGRISAQEGYVPPPVLELPAVSIRIINPDGSVVLLPARLADTAEAQAVGLDNVGPKALETTYLLYAHPEETRTTTRYPRSRLRGPVQMAIIDANGEVVAIRDVTRGATAVSIREPHQWILATKQGLLAHYGIAVGSRLDTENIKPIR